LGQFVQDMHKMPAPLIIIQNPKSGTSRDVAAEKLVAPFRALGKEARLITPAAGSEITALAAQAVAEGASAVVAAGGDGTVSGVANALVSTDVPMGVLPVGTLNHFARDVGIPTDLTEATRTIAAGRTVAVDVGEVNGRVFVNNSSLGLYPVLVKHREMQQRMGFGKWPAFAWAAVAAFRRFPFLTLRLEVDGHELCRRTPLVFIGNNLYEFEGLHIGTRTSLQEGRLCLYVTHHTGRWGLLRLSLMGFLGRLHRGRTFDLLCTQELSVETRRKRISVALDGEVVSMEPPLDYRTRPAALRVIVP
jgi:diacylglycerol kinase family enzyme